MYESTFIYSLHPSGGDDTALFTVHALSGNVNHCHQANLTPCDFMEKSTQHAFKELWFPQSVSTAMLSQVLSEVARDLVPYPRLNS